ncbi:MAG TPA: DUF2178 domain-containing protein [Dehalococcoidia bacterium]|nr:DUF2178 domain-containing protein [Dehalococcoidia bacterium]
MTAKAFRLSTLATIVVLGGLIIWTILADMPVYIPVIGIVVAIVIKYLLRRRTTETIADERLRNIGSRAITVSYRILSVLMASLGLIFIIFKNSLPYEFGIIGATLAFAVCAMLMVQVSLYYIFAARS